MAKDNFLFHEQYMTIMKELTDSEFRQLVCAMSLYSANGTEPAFEDRAMRIAWTAIKERLQADTEAYEEKCRMNRQNGEKGGRPKNQTGSKKPNGFQKNQTVSEKTERFSEKPKKPDIDTDSDTDIDIEKESIEKKPQAAAPVQRKYGEYGWVRLTEEQHSKLVSDLGKTEVDRCIRYVDESAQQTGNKNKWRDWNLVIRKCSREKWGTHTSGGKPNTFHNFPQRSIDFTELEKQLDNQLLTGVL